MFLMTIKKLIRPFTLLYPSIAILAGGILALNLSGLSFPPFFILSIISGMLIVSCLNASSNIINHIFDLEIDKINKPNRPLPMGDISKRDAGFLAALFAIFALGMAWLTSLDLFYLCIIGLVGTILYSVPPIRLKRFHWISNLTIAFPRGLLIIVAGWATIAPINYPEPWLFGSILFFFVLGANTSKDFADIEGDKTYGINSLPVKYGVERAIKLIRPFFIFPFLLIVIYCLLGWLHWAFSPIALFAILGYRAIKLIEDTPETTSIDNNHPSWKLMYLIVSGYTLFIALISVIVGMV